eukprot:Rmarinus@m.18050
MDFCLSSLPRDVLAEIFSRIPCENVLLGSIAKINCEFRELALEPCTRRRVQENFVEVHKTRCTRCGSLEGAVSFNDMCAAVGEGLLSCVMYICMSTKDTPMHEPTDSLRMVLHLAARNGHLDVIRYFLENRGGADILNRPNCNDDSVLHKAALGGHVHVLKYFLEEFGAAHLVSQRNSYCSTVLHLASRGGHVDVIRFLVDEWGAADIIEATDSNGGTVLHVASYFGRVNVVRYLLEERGGADLGLVEATNYFGETALDLAKRKNKENVVDLFSQMAANR